MKEKDMKILGETILLTNDYLDINALKFLKDNPRVYFCTHGEPNFDDLTDEEKQEKIYRKLLQEPSVKNLKPEVKRHGGLMEPILVRHDTMEVIEGNSRLAVYRRLQQEKAEGEWGLIPCDIVSSLTDKQQAAFLNQIHVKGKHSGLLTKKPILPMCALNVGGKMKRLLNCLASPKRLSVPESRLSK